MTVLVLLSACAAQHVRTKFSDVFAGTIAGGTDVVVAGKMDTSGINFYSLQDQGGGEGSHCIALILAQADRGRAKMSHGRNVSVRGHVIEIGALNTLFPDQSGEINGRFWGGTKCDGNLAIFVKHLSVPN